MYSKSQHSHLHAPDFKHQFELKKSKDAGILPYIVFCFFCTYQGYINVPCVHRKYFFYFSLLCFWYSAELALVDSRVARFCRVKYTKMFQITPTTIYQIYTKICHQKYIKYIPKFRKKIISLSVKIKSKCCLTFSPRSVA